MSVRLKTLVEVFEDCSHSTPRMVTFRPGWLWASKCETWMNDSPDQKVTILAVYRSPLVTCTSKMFQPVAGLIIGAPHMDTLAEGVREFDPRMMGHRAEYFVLRLKSADYVESPSCPPLEEIQRITQAEADRIAHQ
ncbi:hypothetical protein SEA_ZIMMER_73 [Mycobacterium phage Zimmer]|nr:hypothetical protein SEA_ZIMMER_73 [Mycobacterium phage Zimmer]